MRDRTRWRKSVIKKYGSEEGFYRFMREIGKKGGRTHKGDTPGNFRYSHERAVVAGRKSKRGKNKKAVDN